MLRGPLSSDRMPKCLPRGSARIRYAGGVSWSEMHRALPFLWTACVLSVSACAAYPVPPGRTAVKTYGTDLGLDNLAIWCLIQDDRGFLWVGSEDGLFRYDGNRFQAFRREQGLPSGDIQALHQDPDGRLWVGTSYGLALIGPDGAVSTQGLPTTSILAIQNGPDGQIWIATPHGPMKRQPHGGFSPVPNWPGGPATALWTSPDHGTVWVASTREEHGRQVVDVCQWREGTWTSLATPGTFRGERIDALAGDRQGRLWARSARDLWVMLPGTTSFRPAQCPSLVAGSRGFLSIDRQGQLWVPTNSGLLHLDGDRWETLGPRQGLPAFGRAVMEDREGNLWIAGLGLNRRLGRRILTSYTDTEGLPSNVAWALTRDGEGALWIGTDKGAARSEQGIWRTIPGTEGVTIRTFARDRQGRIYMGGNLSEILRFDPRTRRLDRFPVEAHRSTLRIFRLQVDTQDRLYVGTEGAGLLEADLTRPSLSFSTVPLPGGAPDERISALQLDAQGRLLAAGTHGLAVRTGDRWQRFTTRDGLRHDHVSYTCTTAGGEILVAYFVADGLSRTRIEGGRLTVTGHLDETGGLGFKKVYLMGEDAQGRLWVGGGRGLNLVTPLGIEHLGAADGLPSDDCNAMAIHCDPDGDVWLGTSGGVARFQMSQYRGLPTPPTTVIVRAQAGQRRLSCAPAETLRLSYRDRTVTFTFTGLSFLSEGQVETQVRLVGLEDDWRATTVREARYPALPPGTYRFEVRSRLGAGAWGATAGQSFQILAPWWRSWWAYTLAGASLLGAAYLILRWRIATLRRHNRELEALVTDRTRELQTAMEALRSQSLTDPLTGLRNRRYLGVTLPEDIARVSRTHHDVRRGALDRHSSNIDLVFLMVDIDHFKTINDEHGHHAGDLVLQQVAEILRAATRDSDTVVRWGGEEFLVVARNASRAEATVLAERVRGMVAAHPFDLGNSHTLHRTCSIGFAYFPLVCGAVDRFHWEQVVDLADQCLYAAKRGGRNAWVGLASVDEQAMSPFERRGYISMVELLEEGVVTTVSSHPEDTLLEWNPGT